MLSRTGGRLFAGRSAGTFTVDGDYAQENDATMEIELAGLVPGEEHDVFVVTGVAALAGRLHIIPIDGFLPQIGQSFEILSAASLTGSFDEVAGAGQYTVSFGPESVTVTVVCPPGDADCNGSANLDDFAAFADCANGPNATPDPTPPLTPADCLDAFDFDADGDNDLVDYSRLELLLTHQ